MNTFLIILLIAAIAATVVSLIRGIVAFLQSTKLDLEADGVTLVTRGMDLFSASHVHRLLQELLGLPVPTWHHHPLLLDAEGRKLAKRRGSPSLADRRHGGEDGRALAEALRRGELPAGITLSQSLHSEA